jgi:hypothetical protein
VTGLMPSGVPSGVATEPLPHRPQPLHTRRVADRRTAAPRVRGRGLSGQAPTVAKGACSRRPALSAPPITGNAPTAALRRARGHGT